MINPYGLIGIPKLLKYDFRRVLYDTIYAIAPEREKPVKDFSRIIKNLCIKATFSSDGKCFLHCSSNVFFLFKKTTLDNEGQHLSDLRY